jgi:hypothetical protein
LERGKGVLSFWNRSAGRVSGLEFLEEKCRKSVWPGYGEPKVELGEVNTFCYLERGDSCICQKCSVVTIYMQDSSQGQLQVETSLHFFNVGFALDVPQVLQKVM